MKRQLKIIILGAIPFLIVLLAWWLVTRFGLVKSYFLPSPQAVAQAGRSLIFEHQLLKDILISVFRILIGFILAVVLALPIGALIGSRKGIERTVEPIIDFIRYTPIPAFIPLLILWLGVGETEKIVIIAASIFFQLVLMVANSIAKVPAEIIQFARTLGLKRKELLIKIIFPHALPAIIDDMRISMGWAWSSLLIAEIVGATSGIGYVIIQAQRLLQTGSVIFVVILVGILGIITDLIFKLVRIYLFPWSKAANHE